jgi:hypothetical protein
MRGDHGLDKREDAPGVQGQAARVRYADGALARRHHHYSGSAVVVGGSAAQGVAPGDAQCRWQQALAHPLGWHD